MLGPEGTTERISAIKAGAEDYLASTADPQLLTQLVISRATRGRRVRELVHRDAITGLLNHVTLLAELEHAVEHSRRHGEPLALLLFELDGFRRISERLGPRGSEEVLLHVAGVFRANVRASDVIGRYGWEAFGMLLRGANAEGAAVLADKLHRVLGEQPAQTAGGELIRLPVRVGSAAFPRDGLTAAGLAHAADRALRERSK
jgi:diguanylate cyclase (GGDEF)-like protein